MKTHLLIISLFILLFASKPSYSQNYSVEGNVFLEFQDNHQNITIKFERIAPSYLIDSVYSDSLGYYNLEVESGVYNISYSKDGFIENSLEKSIYNNTIIEDQFLEVTGLAGELTGFIEQGVYKVGEDAYVPENEILVIEKGTVLLFKQDVKFEIFGQLVAEGTLEDSIKFSKYNSSETWMGIDFKEGSSSESILKYTTVEYSNDRGICVYKCSPKIEKSLVQYNSHEGSNNGQSEEDGGGAGICLKYSNTALKHMMIINNSGTTLGCGIFCNDGAPRIENSIIANNKNQNLGDMRPGGGIYSSANLVIENCVISDNENSLGAGIYISNFGSFIPSVLVSNCIVTNNFSNYGAGGISFWNASTEVFNSLIWNNEGGNIHCDNDWLGVNVTTNVNSDSCDAYGNISSDPMFVNQPAFDFRLIDGSPCIDAGNNDLVTTEKDFDQNYRIWNAHNYDTNYVDMGAFEFGSENNPLGIVRNDKISEVLLYPNPASDIVCIESGQIKYVEVFNSNGQLVILSRSNEIDVSNLPKGLFLIKVYSDILEDIETIKFIKN